MSFVPEPTPILNNEFLWETKGVALCLVLLLWLIGMASTPASSNFWSKIGHPGSLTGLWLLSKAITILSHEEKNFRHPDFLVVMTVMRTGDGSVDSNLIIDLGKSEDGCILCISYLLPQTSPKLPWNNKCLLSSLWVVNLGGLSGEVLLPSVRLPARLGVGWLVSDLGWLGWNDNSGLLHWLSHPSTGPTGHVLTAQQRCNSEQT